MQLKNLFKNDYLKGSQAIKKVPGLIFNWNANYPNVPDLPQSLKENSKIFSKNSGQNHFLPHRFQFIFHCASYHSILQSEVLRAP
jgi:hypothetical protein